MRDAAKQSAEVILLPELYISHYFCQSEDTDNFSLAEELYSTSFITFSALAKELDVGFGTFHCLSQQLPA